MSEALEGNSGAQEVYQYLDEYMKMDRSLAQMALRVDGRAMQFMSSFMEDQELLLLAIRSYPKAFCLAPPALQADEAFLLQAVLKNSEVLQSMQLEDMRFVESLLRLVNRGCFKSSRPLSRGVSRRFG